MGSIGSSVRNAPTVYEMPFAARFRKNWEEAKCDNSREDGDGVREVDREGENVVGYANCIL